MDAIDRAAKEAAARHSRGPAAMRLYRALLRVLPRDVRRRHAAQMALTFADLQALARDAGPLRTVRLWIAELSGLFCFALHARFRRLALRRMIRKQHERGPEWGHDLYWAWRNVRARGVRAGLIIGLLAISLAANTLMFAAADSLVFSKLPFPDADELVSFADANGGRIGISGNSVSANLLDHWRQQHDIFAGVETYLTKTLFLRHQGRHERVTVVDLTPGMMGLLGVSPNWGRALADGDAAITQAGVVLISEALARRHFGDPASAVGAELDTTVGPLAIAGVMADTFRFPSASPMIWRALDPRGPLTRNFSGTFAVARLAKGVSFANAAAMVEQRAADVGAAAGRGNPYSATLSPMAAGLVGSFQSRAFFVLMGAAFCLLAIACANVTSLELAGAISRSRTSAVQLALGASRLSLARVAVLESALIFGAAGAGGWALANGGMSALVSMLPASMTQRTANPIDLDARAMIFLVVTGAGAWLLTAMPMARRGFRADLLSLLKLDDRTSAATVGGARIRRVLTIGQISLAIMLAMSAMLWARSYQSLLGLDKGFASRNVASISYTIPPEFYAEQAEHRAFEGALLAKLANVRGVIAVAPGSPPTGALEVHGDVRMFIDDRPLDTDGINLGLRYVEPSFFSVLGIPLKQGRMLRPREPLDHAIVSESFAKRYWPGVNPVGRAFRQSNRHPWVTVAGVAGDLTLRPTGLKGMPPEPLQVYFARQAQAPPRPVARNPPIVSAAGGSSRFLTVMARFATPDLIEQARAIARRIEPRFDVEVSLVDEDHAKQFSDVRLVARVVGGFGMLSLLVAVLGLYGVLTLLVSARRREIGIRMALGADRSDIRRMVMSSSVRLAMAGALLGVIGATAVARAVEASLWGVRPAEPAVVIVVAAVAIVTALLASWRPAMTATAVDPSVLLRSQN